MFIQIKSKYTLGRSMPSSVGLVVVAMAKKLKLSTVANFTLQPFHARAQEYHKPHHQRKCSKYKHMSLTQVVVTENCPKGSKYTFWLGLYKLFKDINCLQI